jgi:hypothetical protein
MTDVIRLSLPLTAWLVSFSAVYGLHGIVCSSQWSATPSFAGLSQGRLVMLAAFVFAIVIQAAIFAFLWSERFGGASGLMRWTSLTLAVAGLIAVPWTLFPVAALSLCI